MTSSSRPFRRTYPTFVAIALTLVTAVPSAMASDSTVSLPPLARWSRSEVDLGSSSSVTELRLTRMFQPGGLGSPTVVVVPGDRMTFSATVETEYKPRSGYYLFWLELEFLDGNRVAGKFESSPIRGTAPEQVLAVTGVVPEGSRRARVSIRIQNRISQVLPNVARVKTVRLDRLAKGGAGPIALKPAAGLPDSAGSRVARIAVSADWPDGSAVALATTRGTVTPTVVLSGGRGEGVLAYGQRDVGKAEVSASVADRSARLVVDDPHAARLTLRAVEADGTGNAGAGPARSRGQGQAGSLQLDPGRVRPRRLVDRAGTGQLPGPGDQGADVRGHRAPGDDGGRP